MIGWIILGMVLLFFCVILLRTLFFRPEEKTPQEISSIALNEEKIVSDMVDMIRCKTVSDREESLVDRSEFARFEALLQKRFPKIHTACHLEKIGKTGLLYHLPGDSHEKPTVLMSHYDVVPVDEAGWDRPAFEGLIEDGCIWGRGTLDTKGTLCGVTEALEMLLTDGYRPKQDLYLSFSGEEEIDGNSCAEIVSYLEEKGVVPALVLDEGGAVVQNVFPGMKEECALVGVGEKGGLNLQFTLASEGGHASTPPVNTICGKLAKAMCKIEKKPFSYQLTPPVKKMFDTLGRHSNFLFRMIFANLWCFAPVLDLYGRLCGGEINALLRTTVAITRMEGSRAYNVLPPKASFAANLRLLGKDNIQSAKEYLHCVIGNEKVQIDVVNGMNPSIYSDTDCEGWDTLKTAISQTWPEAVVSPYLMLACSDSRHYCRISDKVYRFSAMRLSKEERASIHGNNERIPIPTLLKTVEFYVRLLQMI